MEQYKCKPLKVEHRYVVTVPGSKSITNRALLLGALAKGTTICRGVLFSDDSRVFMEALKSIGFQVEISESENCVVIEGLGGGLPENSQEREVYVGSAGTAARFLTAMLALSGQKFLVNSSEQMKARPMRPLLEALEALGAKFEYMEEEYSFPFRILGMEEKKVTSVDLNIDASSQFLSALLLSGVMCPKGLTIHLTGKRSAKAYVTISMKMMEAFGVSCRQIDENTYEIVPGQEYTGRDYQIEPDVSAACYFYGMAAITGGEFQVLHVHRDTTQGDIQLVNVLEKMGCEVSEETDGIVVRGSEKQLKGIHINMSNFSDQTMTLAAVAPFASSETVIDGIGHIRGQESDRIRGIVTELRRLGITCDEREDGMTIYPGKIVPCEIETYEDHRMAMAFAMIGSKIPGIVINDPMCCRKTFENYFDVLTNLDLTFNI